MRLLTLWYCYIRTALIRNSQFRGEFYGYFLANVLWITTMYVITSLFFMHTDVIAGWTKVEVYLLVLTASMVEQTALLLFWSGLNRLSQLITTGDFDFILTRPVAAVWQLAFSRFAPVHVAQLGVMLSLFGLVIHTNDISITLWQLLVFIGFCLCGLIVLFCLHLLMQSLAFWFIKIDNIQYLFFSLNEVARFPSSVFGAGRWIVFSIIPVALVGNVPTLFLLGRGSMWLAVVTVCVTAAVMIVAAATYWFGQKNYSSASS